MCEWDPTLQGIEHLSEIVLENPCEKSEMDSASAYLTKSSTHV